MKKVVVNNVMQKDYSFDLVEPMGKNFDPEFRPELTPKEMLELGVFGGVYMSDKPSEYPRDWFENAKLATEYVSDYGNVNGSNRRHKKRDKNLNYFGINASQPLSVWRAKGWIYKDDPRGWFEWYCRYYMGRRIPDEDKRQIKRWKMMRRHIAQIQKHCRVGDYSCHTKQRQALLHWAYDSRKY